MPPDWADRTAGQILTIAFASPEARMRIASLLRLIRIEGQLAGVVESREIVNQSFGKQTTGGES